MAAYSPWQTLTLYITSVVLSSIFIVFLFLIIVVLFKDKMRWHLIKFYKICHCIILTLLNVTYFFPLYKYIQNPFSFTQMCLLIPTLKEIFHLLIESNYSFIFIFFYIALFHFDWFTFHYKLIFFVYFGLFYISAIILIIFFSIEECIDLNIKGECITESNIKYICYSIYYGITFLLLVFCTITFFQDIKTREEETFEVDIKRKNYLRLGCLLLIISIILPILYQWRNIFYFALLIYIIDIAKHLTVVVIYIFIGVKEDFLIIYGCKRKKLRYKESHNELI